MRYFALIYPARNGQPDVLGNEPSFGDPRAAWAWLKLARRQEEDQHPDWNVGEYSDTVLYLDYAAGTEEYGKGVCEFGNPHEDWPLEADGTGRILGWTPGVGAFDGDLDVECSYVGYAVVAR